MCCARSRASSGSGRYRGWAKKAGFAKASVAETGAVTGVQRFGSTLNVHTHFHLLCLDGVYLEGGEDGEELRFEVAPAPTSSELGSLLQHNCDGRAVVRHG
jgi:hypothetical protein